DTSVRLQYPEGLDVVSAREFIIALADSNRTLDRSSFLQFDEDSFKIFENNNPNKTYPREEILRISEYEGYYWIGQFARKRRSSKINKNEYWFWHNTSWTAEVSAFFEYPNILHDNKSNQNLQN
ncbi:hypothetical protein PFISCL1PPCAC_6735, partial [Pristionchus fissidentatus]